jgi:hypothetical protein
MRRGVRAQRGERLRFAVFIGGLLLVVLGLIAFSITSTGDYQVRGPVGGDNAGPGLQALLRGSLAGYVSQQPVIGLTSILLRLPVVALASALGTGSLVGYQVGALVCLFPLALGGAWLVSEPALSKQNRSFRLAAVLLVVLSPIVQNVLNGGHPEGVLSALLATVAVLVSMRGRAGWAALLLGLAISTKETAVIALVPVMLALPERRRLKVAAIAGAVFLVLCGTVWLADPAALLRSLHGEGATRFLTPFSLLWPVSSPLHTGTQLSVARVMPLGLTRTPATLLTLTCATPLATLWYARARHRGAAPQPLVLLVLFGLLRCALDSTQEAYYWASFLIPLATWEALEDRFPVKTLLLNGAVLVLFSAVGQISPSYLYVLSTGGEILMAVYLARLAMVTPGPAPAVPPAPQWTVAAVAAGHEH